MFVKVRPSDSCADAMRGKVWRKDRKQNTERNDNNDIITPCTKYNDLIIIPNILDYIHYRVLYYIVS